MKRYFQILLGGGLLSLLAVQSYGAITIGNSGGNVQDDSWTYAHWANSQTNGAGAKMNYAQSDAAISPGNNDVYTFSVAAGLANGTFTLVDLGAPSGDVYNLLNFNGGATLGTATSAASNAGNIQSPTAALANNDYGRFQWTGLGPGSYSVQVESTASNASNGGIAMRFTAVPEPSVSLLAMLGLVGLVARRRR